MIYGVDDRPPAAALAILAFQHAALALALEVYVLIVAQEIGLDATATQAFVASSVLVIGVGTLLQAFRAPFGAGLMLVHIPDPVLMGAFAAVAKSAGMAAAGGALALASMTQIALSRVIPRMRSVFPPEVIGVMVCMLGLSMAGGGVQRLLGMRTSLAPVDATSAAVGLLTLGSIVAVAIWSRGTLRLFALIVGLLVGGVASYATGTLHFDGFGRDTAWLALPSLTAPSLDFTLAGVLPMVLIALLVGLDTVGSVAVMEKMNDAGWRRSDMRAVSGGICASGMANILGGLIGGYGTGISSANIGLSSATGASSRILGVATGLVLIAAACFPPLIQIVTLTPEPVRGAITLYAAAFLVTSGMELILSRMLDSRRTFMVGLSMSAGVALIAMPALPHGAPEWAREMLSSPLTVATLLAILLNLVFRLGTSRTVSMTIDAQTPMRDVTDFLETSGASWAARKDTILRAGNAVVEAVEVLRDSGHAEGPIELTVSFDEYNLDLEFTYAGTPLALTPSTVDPAKALDGDDDDFNLLILSASNALLARLADRAKAFRRGDRAVFALHFEH
ncbi:solute carrier family 23 protein [Azospirillum sp. SYSU D00513]|uniref:uracil-xanthine permease family protein n=1 Tax=Azospirillum sp. SYSU D00513 TaxID=2812561 RepID=UPI001A963382|nr:solute carrier family 23 protein [Azospirillum sp. SYSU D00513]